MNYFVIEGYQYNKKSKYNMVKNQKSTLNLNHIFEKVLFFILFFKVVV